MNVPWTHLVRRGFILAVFGLLLPASTIPAMADDDSDPPGRVARLNFTRGSVSFQPAGTNDWATAELNRPLTTGDKLWSDQDSLAELRLGSAAVRLSSQTGISFLNLNDQVAQISVAEGTVEVHLRELDPDETFEVDTPNLAFTLLRPGDYRLAVNENGDTTIATVWSGDGEATGGGQAYAVHAEQTATFAGTDSLTADVEQAEPADDFDQWCMERNQREDRPPRYVSQDMVGYEDLDDYGYWRQDPVYGPVWVPNGVVAGWAPYRYGHWVWISPWGWTWVEDEPWGFAPFHYGRWVVVGGAWGWLPGPVVAARPVYAPALVVWVGGGPRGGVVVAGGAAVAWFPLGPREVYVPPYAVSRTYVTNVNVTNTTVTNTYVTNVYNTTVVNKTVNVTNVTYVNRTYVTATSQTSFTSAQPVARNVVRVDPNELARAPVGTAAGAGVAPEQRSVLGTNAPEGSVAHPPSSVVSRPVVAKTTPPPAPVSFAAQREAIQANGGRPLPPAQYSTLRASSHEPASQPAVRIAPAATAHPAQNTTQAPQTTRSDRPPSAQPGAVHTNNANTSQPASNGANGNRPATSTNAKAAHSTNSTNKPKDNTGKPKHPSDKPDHDHPPR